MVCTKTMYFSSHNGSLLWPNELFSVLLPLSTKEQNQKQNRTEKEQSFLNSLKMSHTACVMNMYSVLVQKLTKSHLHLRTFAKSGMTGNQIAYARPLVLKTNQILY